MITPRRSPALINAVEDAMSSDDADRDRQSEKLDTLYSEATDVERAVLDKAFVCLCGWTLKTLISEAS
jgi:predicted transcriptional regulator